MKVVRDVPKQGNKKSLKQTLREKERPLRETAATLIRDREGHWVLKRHPGWINWDQAPLGCERIVWFLAALTSRCGAIRGGRPVGGPAPGHAQAPVSAG